MKQPRGRTYVLAAAIMLAAPYISPPQHANSSARLAQLNRVKMSRFRGFNIIAHHYVDSVTIDSSLPLPEIIPRLDPFSYYVSKANYLISQQRSHDEPCKYGIYIHSTDGRILFTSVESGGAADRAGIWPEDEVLAVGNQGMRGKDSLAHYLFSTSDSLDLTLFEISRERKKFRVTNFNRKQRVSLWN